MDNNMSGAVNQEYINILNKFCEDEALINLINQCIIDSIRQNEDFYLVNGKYPGERNLLSKLITDLKKAKINKIISAKQNQGGQYVKK